MRNRAKCKLCSDIIESFARSDNVSCSCGEISVDGGDQYFRVGAIHFENFVRIDDEGNEVRVSIKDMPDTASDSPAPLTKPSREELLDMLDDLVKRIEELPANALYSPITHADFCSLILLLSAILRAT